MGAAASVYAAKMNMALDKSQIVTGSKLAHIQGVTKSPKEILRQYTQTFCLRSCGESAGL
jgi:hypothetical protein